MQAKNGKLKTVSTSIRAVLRQTTGQADESRGWSRRGFSPYLKCNVIIIESETSLRTKEDEHTKQRQLIVLLGQPTASFKYARYWAVDQSMSTMGHLSTIAHKHHHHYRYHNEKSALDYSSILPVFWGGVLSTSAHVRRANGRSRSLQSRMARGRRRHLLTQLFDVHSVAHCKTQYLLRTKDVCLKAEHVPYHRGVDPLRIYRIMRQESSHKSVCLKVDSAFYRSAANWATHCMRVREDSTLAVSTVRPRYQTLQCVLAEPQPPYSDRKTVCQGRPSTMEKKMTRDRPSLVNILFFLMETGGILRRRELSRGCTTKAHLR